MRRKAVKGADQATTSGSELISEKPDRFHNIAEPAAFYGTFDKRDDVTLEFALAKFISNDDIAFGTEYATDVTDKIDKKYRKRRNLHQYVAYPSGYLAFVFFGATAQKIFGHSDEANWDITSVVFVLLFLVCLASLMLWSHYQYDFNDRLNKPISLPDDADPRFDEFLFYLQQKQRNGRSIAYSYSRFRRGRVFVPRRLFFGRLRYLLFSDHLDTRSFVTRYLTGLPAPSEIFIHKDDLGWIIFDGKQKQNRHQAIIKSEPEQKGSGGRPLSPRYADMIIMMFGDPRLHNLDLANRNKAVTQIVAWLIEPYENTPKSSGWKPHAGQAKVYAEKFYDRLKFLNSQQAH